VYLADHVRDPLKLQMEKTMSKKNKNAGSNFRSVCIAGSINSAHNNTFFPNSSFVWILEVPQAYILIKERTDSALLRCLIRYRHMNRAARRPS
jgi:hypothetical protein